MRDHLDGFSEVIASPLFFDDGFINPAGCYIVGLGCGHIQKSLIVAQVQVGFRTIFRNITLPVFIGIKGARVNINVRIQFLNSD